MNTLERNFNIIKGNAILPILSHDKQLCLNKLDQRKAITLFGTDLYDLIGRTDIKRNGVYLLVRKKRAMIILLQGYKKNEFYSLISKIQSSIEKAQTSEEHALIFKNEFDAWK